MARNQPSKWNIGLSAWIIQDGSYPDIGVDDTAEFAVEFHQQPGAAVEKTSSDVSATLVRDAMYQVVAEKVQETNKLIVLDIGILVYSQFGLQVPVAGGGTRCRTELNLGVDPFNFAGGVPALVYSWRVTSILIQKAPFVETLRHSDFLGGRKFLTRDPSKLSSEEIRKTDAWKDDQGRGDYILVCDLLPMAAK